MTEELIRQNAEEYAKRNEQTLINKDSDGYLMTDYSNLVESYIAGAHSRDEEIEELKKENDALHKINFALQADLETANEKLQYRQDAINLLTDELDKLLNPWISVKDRLPEKTKGTFSCEIREDEADKILIYKDTRGYIHTGYLNKNGHWRDLDRDNAAIYEVTHWMPIKK